MERLEDALWRYPLPFIAARVSRSSAIEDTQLRGPYAKRVHTHRFIEERGGTTIEDVVTYALPFGPLGCIAHPLVMRQLNRIFEYRASVLLREFS